MIRFYIFAGTSEQAKQLAMRMSLATHEWKYLSQHEHLYGVRDGVMLVYGSYHSRDDWFEFAELARTREMTILYIQ